MVPKEISEMATSSAATAQQSSFTNQILHGDCIEVMRQMPASSVDFILTDPPYYVYRIGKHGYCSKYEPHRPTIKKPNAEIWPISLIFAGSLNNKLFEPAQNRRFPKKSGIPLG
jgi:hypothetical protein